jgi:hypothetical protein
VSTDDETLDHFAPLLRWRRRWLARPVWCLSHALAFVIGVAGTAALLALAGLITGVAFQLGVPAITTSEEDVKLLKESVPTALRVLLASSAVWFIARLALGQLLKRVAPQLPLRDSHATAPGRPSLRETRRQFQARARRENRRMEVLSPSTVPWEGGISLLARAARLLGVLVLGLVMLVFVSAALLIVMVFVLFAALVGETFASRYLSAHVPAAEEAAEAPSPPPPPPRPQGPSPSLLVYLFADRLLRSDTALKLGAPVPCSDQEVRMTDLAAATLAAAFWRLGERDALRLTSTTRRRLLLFKQTRVDVERLRAERLPGLEGRLMEVPSEDPDAYVDEDTSGRPGPLGDVRAVVQSWLSGGQEDPEWAIVAELVDEAEALGVVERGEEDADASESKIRCSEVNAVKAHFEAFDACWHRFGEDEPALRSLLLRECAKAIAGSRVYPETEGPIRTTLAWLFRAHSRATRPWPRSVADEARQAPSPPSSQ